MEEMIKKMMGDIQKIMANQQNFKQKITAKNQTRDMNIRNLERNGRQLEELPPKKVIPTEVEKEAVAKDKVIEIERVAKIPLVNQPQPAVSKPPPSFPQRLAKQKEEATYKKFLDLLKQLEDKSLARPEGIIEDVLVQVGSLIFLTDFVILDFEPYSEVPFIWGHPSFATGRALIDVAACQLTMRVHDKVEVFNVYKALKLPKIYEKLSAITVVNEDTKGPLITCHDSLERALVGEDIFGDTKEFEML
ncbi:uncharacterized protein LOC132064961 [Lycium ferocissimum]|uniref:uncharacterized protein LOC132064961 n=1 Tax=Lycium ferocissimum TaxID=112874 RepID=UPI0028159CBB|nr:uncharacterized protein LOC132064961 [Lycium ferocissimum]